MIKRLTLGLTLISALTLSACSSGGGGQDGDTVLGAGSAVLSSIRNIGKTPPRPQPVTVTRQLLDDTMGEVMQVIPENSGLQDFMLLAGRRNDATPGVVEVWQSSDNLQLIMREGVLVGTRGLGGDIRSAEAAATIAGFDGQGGGGQRLITIDRRDGTAQTVPFACDMTQLGRETIQIVDQRISTYRMREDCIYNQTRLTNEYWVETAGGRMRKSRQWAGPVFGYIAFERLKN